LRRLMGWLLCICHWLPVLVGHPSGCHSHGIGFGPKEVSSPLLSSSVIVRKARHIAEPQFPYLKNGDLTSSLPSF
jgi:hypothetical protein